MVSFLHFTLNRVLWSCSTSWQFRVELCWPARHTVTSSLPAQQHTQHYCTSLTAFNCHSIAASHWNWKKHNSTLLITSCHTDSKLPKMEYCIELMWTLLRTERIRLVKEPKFRWLQSVEEDPKNKGRTIGRPKPQPREYWRTILEESMVQQGLQCQKEKNMHRANISWNTWLVSWNMNI